MFKLQYLSQIFIKFNNQGVFRNPQDMQIPKLSLKFKIVQDFMEKKTNNKKREVIMFIARQCNVGWSRLSVKGWIISGTNLNQPYHIGINANYPSEAISGHLGHPPAPFLQSKIRPIKLIML